MEYISLFDVIGPNMIGPSSSHTAGACAMSRMARHMFDSWVSKATFTLYGSFARTYKGHGTDRALLGGILGFDPDDARIPNSMQIADQDGMKYEFILDDKTKTRHPNTADIRLEDKNGKVLTVRGESVGGGKVIISRIDNIDVEFTGEFNTLIVEHRDRPGVLEAIVNCMSRHGINIAFLKMFREEKGGKAFSIIESDTHIPHLALDELKQASEVRKVMFLPRKYKV